VQIRSIRAKRDDIGSELPDGFHGPYGSKDRILGVTSTHVLAVGTVLTAGRGHDFLKGKKKNGGGGVRLSRAAASGRIQRTKAERSAEKVEYVKNE